MVEGRVVEVAAIQEGVVIGEVRIMGEVTIMAIELPPAMRDAMVIRLASRIAKAARYPDRLQALSLAVYSEDYV